MILEDLQDPGNLGTIMRAGEGAGISGIILSHNCVDIYNPKTIRSTMGSIYRVPFIYVEDLKEAVTLLKDNKISIYAAHLKQSQDYEKLNFKESTAFMIGNEGNGLSDQLSNMADAYLKIPMLGKVESLNAAIAASVLMYEVARQRRK
jgi:TrmH family RNA methyltransferase